MPVKGLITWNAVISGYSQNGLAYDVLELYEKMRSLGVFPDPVTLVSVLSSCAHLGAQKIVREVEKLVEANGFASNVFVSNALISMYARCGNLAKARAVFDIIPVKTVVSWTAMIGCYGMHGMVEVGLELFDDMIKSGIRPDGTVFVMVLSACSHSGLTDKGLEFFSVMKTEYKLEPGPEHYSCVVDLLGRAGLLVEVLEESRRNLENPINDERERIREKPGYSYVEHKGRIHLFLAGDRSLEQTGEVHRMLDELETSVMEITGNTNCDRGEENLSSRHEHSERLAVAFAILNSSPGTEILVIKNLRVCDDCHVFIKLVSKIVDRRFVIRDASRFHYFKDRFCSCKDYW